MSPPKSKSLVLVLNGDFLIVTSGSSWRGHAGACRHKMVVDISAVIETVATYLATLGRGW